LSTGEVDLESIGADVSGTDLDAETGARVRLDRAGLLSGLGRLGDLAVWWAGVRGEAAAGPAGDVVRIVPAGVPVAAEDPGAQLPGPLAQGPLPRDPAPVRTVPLDPPRDHAAALAWGVATADALADSGTDLLLVSAPDLVASRVLAAQLLGLDAVEANGWPTDTGIDDRTWMDQVTAIRDGLFGLRGLRPYPEEVLDALGSPVLSAATALLLRSAARRTPALLDGSGAAAAALLAQRLSPYSRDWWQVGHLGDHPLHERCLDTLRLPALTRLGITLEDGTGALLGLTALDLAACLLAGAG
jgi:nicotinate-nucleotide--dimethylbenzimidazole phosphoribosyltransferase